jgi:putative transposase
LLDFDAQVQQALLEVLLTYIPLEINARELTNEKLWQLLGSASVGQTTVESVCQSLEIAPSGNTVREHLTSALDQSAEGLQRLEANINQALIAQLPTRLRQELRAKAWEVAGDWITIPYHGVVEEGETEVRGGQPKAGTSKFHTYATLALLNKNRRVTVALTVVRPGEKQHQVVTRLLNQARRLGLRIKRGYFDKAFCSIEVFKLLRRRRVPYIIPIPQRGENGIKTLCYGRSGYRTRYTFRNADGSYSTDVVIACKYSCNRFKRKGVRYFAYAVYGVDELKPEQVFQAYRRRFSIESGYRQLHQVRARTSTRNPAWRLLYIGLALLLVNLYVLLRRYCGLLRQYGSRQRRVFLTLELLATTLRNYWQKLYGLKQLGALRRPLLN